MPGDDLLLQQRFAETSLSDVALRLGKVSFDASVVAKEPTMLGYAYAPFLNLGYFLPPQVSHPPVRLEPTAAVLAYCSTHVLAWTDAC